MLRLPAPRERTSLQAPHRPLPPSVAGKRRGGAGGARPKRWRPAGRPSAPWFQGVTRFSSGRKDRLMMGERTLEQPAGIDVGAALLDEYLELKEKLGPLEKRLDEVRDRLRDLVTEHGHFIDEVRGVVVHVEPRFRKEYDPERLRAAFPRLAGCVKPSVDLAQLEACLRAGMVTDTELEREGVLTRSLHSRALIVKPLGQRPAGLAMR